MYTPDLFNVKDSAAITSFMVKHSFATIVTCDEGIPHATHMPVLYDPDRGGKAALVSHLARGNPQWRHFENGREVLVIFTGPHAYISPAWYVKTPAVPTWNYTAVHAYGVPRVVTDRAEFSTMLRDLIEFYEAHRMDRWPAEMPDEFFDRLMQGIVGVEITITRIEAKFKLSQNRPDDQPGVIAALSASAEQTDRDIAELMKQTLKS